MFQKIINKGTVNGGIRQYFSFMFWRSYDPDIYLDKKIEQITFNDVLYVIDEFPHDIQTIIKPIAIAINSKIKPIDIVNIQQNEIYIPSNSGQVEKSKKLWEGWLLFLIYLCLHDSDIDRKNYEINREDLKANLKILYADTENNFSTILHHLICTDTFKSRKISHYIFTNQKGKLNPNILTQNQIANIIPNITTPETIADEKFGKNKFACLHIEKLNQEISQLTRQVDINNEIKKKIIEVLKNALN